MLEGRLNEFRLGDVFQLLAWTRKSGALSVDAGPRRGRVDFSGGQVAFAIADVRRAELGARLANAGVVDDEGLRRVVEAQQAGPGRVAEVLLAEGLDEEVVDGTLREHIEDAVFTLMRTADGGFTFEPDEEDGDRPGPRLDTEALIAEGARRLEEWETVRERIPSSDAVLAMTPNPPAENDHVTVSTDQWRLLVLVDGTRSVAQLVELTGQGEFATSQVLAELVEAGLVDAVDPDDGDTGLGELLARRASLRELEESELGTPAEQPEPQPEPEAAPRFDARPGPELAVVPELDEWLDAPSESGADAEVEPAPEPEGAPEPDALTDLDEVAADLDEAVADLDESVADLGDALPFGSEPEPDTGDRAAADSEPQADPDPEPAFPVEDEPVPPADPGPVAEAAPAWADAPEAWVGSALDGPPEGSPEGGPADADAPARDADPEPATEVPHPDGEPVPADDPPAAMASHEADPGSPARPGVDRAQVARELASLGLEGPPAAPAPMTDEPPRRLTRDEDVTRGLLVRLMDGVRKA